MHDEHYLPKAFYEADIVISLPCLKTASGVVFTGGIKNISLGVTPGNIYGVAEDNPCKTQMVSHKMSDGDLDKWSYVYFILKPAELCTR
ncbi:MAG: DUF362 domain-containing protein [Clostridiales bacterium]|nr:DUF362 domain-containing protein [Clostridiales bacterium]